MDFADYPGHGGDAPSIKLQEKKSLKLSILHTLYYIYTTTTTTLHYILLH